MSDCIHRDARIGHVHLKMADLDRALAFYRDIRDLRSPGGAPGGLHVDGGRLRREALTIVIPGRPPERSAGGQARE
jgi:catechol 2,3-dioxygenase-like lactoylglutathione lyase family enzyme